MAAGAKEEVVLWTSSELPDTGTGLVDYQTNAAVDRWINEQVLLPPSITRCTVPKGVFSGEGALLRLIGYGHELNLTQPPRPADPKAAWEPLWAVKLRVKSVATTMLGMSELDGTGKPASDQSAPVSPEREASKDKPPGALDILRGVLGR